MRTAVGTMTGTSKDGIDAVAVKIEGFGFSMKPSFVSISSVPYGSLRNRLHSLSSENCDASELKAAGNEIGMLTATAISNLKIDHIDLIALHGQTIYHEPPKSLQLLNPEPIVDRFNCTVLTDPRAADLQQGGQGAPITPLADWIMFREEKKSVGIVNLGGFCNITILEANGQPCGVRGFDLCCCNLLLDSISRSRLNKPYDENGSHAEIGLVNIILYKQLKEKLNEQYNQNRSLGSGDDFGQWILEQGSKIKTSDLLATTTKAIGSFISEIVESVDQILIAGGGVNNKSLVRAIGEKAQKTDVLGVPAQAREAMSMAILAALDRDGISITLPQITGRKETTEVVGWVQVSP
ncbi:MAG: anhydro-N-acetylmuramic acid kinase [Phycisphaerales bacterium]|nr:anhydro-N-acetylmuramic acid kinase [Phycisphaerales bacterium]